MRAIAADRRSTSKLILLALLLLLVFTAVACGNGSKSTPGSAPVAQANHPRHHQAQPAVERVHRTPAPVWVRPWVELPRSGAHFDSPTVMVSGRATPNETLCISTGADYDCEVHVRSDGRFRGRASLDVGSNMIEVDYANLSIGPRLFRTVYRDPEPGQKVEPKEPFPPLDAAEAADRKSEYLGSLEGLTQDQVYDRIGDPDHTQDVAGEEYWYYQYGDNDWQIVFDNGVVVQENRY